MVFLWRKAFARALVGSRLIQATYGMHQGLLQLGSTKHLFGSKQHMMEMRKAKEKRACILMPSSKFKTTWTIIIVLLLVYTAIFVPFRIAFLEKETIGLTIIEAVVDILFAFDIIVNFLSAIEDRSGKLIVEPRKIAQMYLKGWFWLDFLACFPFQLI